MIRFGGAASRQRPSRADAHRSPGYFTPIVLARSTITKAMMRKALEPVLPRHITQPAIKKKVPNTPLETIIFAPEDAKRIESMLGNSPVLRQTLARDPVTDFRHCCVRGRDAEFWARCIHNHDHQVGGYSRFMGPKSGWR